MEKRLEIWKHWFEEDFLPKNSARIPKPNSEDTQKVRHQAVDIDKNRAPKMFLRLFFLKCGSTRTAVACIVSRRSS